MYYEPMAERDSAAAIWPRRAALRAGALSALALTSGFGLAGDGPTGRPPNQAAAVYMPTWLAKDRYDQIGATLPQAASRPDMIGRVILAFATPSADGPQVAAPEIPAELITIIKELPSRVELGLSIGGGQHRAPEEWRPAIAEPTRFADGVASVGAAVEAQLRRGIQVIDIDCEADVAASDLTSIMQALNTAMPQHMLTMAVPATHDTDRFDTKGLRGIVSEYNIMTYDEYGIAWSETAGRLASRALLQTATQIWTSKVGGHARLRVGIPTYGYLYAAASGEGAMFDRHASRSLAYPEIPYGAALDDLTAGTSAAVTPQGYVAFQSPAVIRHNLQAVRKQQADVSTFFWSADGLTTEHLAAVL
jgi:hypothetical protein